MTSPEDPNRTTEDHNRARLAKFVGQRSTIKVELWLNLFEVETLGQQDSARITNLMRYLAEEALNFFASDIAPKMSTMTWPDARRLMTERFGIAVRHPLVETNKRYLRGSETIKEYYEDKLRLLRLAELDDEATLAMLTDGVPVAYRGHLSCCPASTPVEWLKHAVRLEATNRPKPPFADHSKQRPPSKTFVANGGNNAGKASARKPPTPCRHCQDAGETVFHWHRECPRRKATPPATGNTALAEAEVEAEEVLTAEEVPITTLVINRPAKQLLDIACRANGQPVRALVDTGSTITIASMGLADRLNIRPNPGLAIDVQQVTGRTRTSGRATIALTIGKRTLKVSAHVIRGFRHELLLGLDVGRLFGLKLDLSRNQVFRTSGPDGKELCHAAAISPLYSLIAAHSDLFAQATNDVGCTGLAEHHIRLKDPNMAPIACRPHRHSLLDQEEIRRQVTDLKARGLVRDSVSPWAFPVTLAPKSDGSKRLCIDYRRLNATVVDVRQPLPLIQDIIDRLARQRVFSRLDVAWGFWHIPMATESIERTAFVTADGHFEWLRMPFGLKCAPATFQRVIRLALGDLIGKGVDPYLDDIIIATEDMDSHVRILAEVFARLQANHFRLRPEKCLFGQAEFECLGFVVSACQVRPSPKKTEAVANFPTPTDPKAIQRFIGLANYYRQFVPNFSRIAAPLTTLTRADVSWQWTDREQSAFEELKRRLTTDPVITIFDATKPCVLHTDGSKIGIGGILMQADADGHNQVVAYFSRRLNHHEANYTVSEIECLAVIEAVEHFHVYLHGLGQIRHRDRPLSPPVALQYQEADWKALPMVGQTLGIQLPSGPPPWPPTPSRRRPLLRPNRDVPGHRRTSGATARACRTPASATSATGWLAGHPSRRPDQTGGARLPPCPCPPSLPRRTRAPWHRKGQATDWPPLLVAKLGRRHRPIVRTCHACQLAKVPNTSALGQLQPIATPALPWHMWSMDTIVMGSAAENTRAKNVQVIIDHHSRFVWAFATPRNTTETVTNILRQLFAAAGTPKILVTDRGTNFAAKQFRRFLGEHQVAHRMTSPYHPMANGMVEKANHTILNGLRMAILDHPNKKWSSLLGDVVANYNRTPHSSTGFEPRFLQFGLPVADDQPDIAEARRLATARSEAAKARRKAEFDARHKPSGLTVGDLVTRSLADNHPSRVKTSPANTGPYQITRSLGLETFEIERLADKHLFTAHSSQLHLFRPRPETSPSGE